MKIIIKTKNIDQSTALNSFVEKKFAGLKKFINVLKREDEIGKTLAEVFVEVEKISKQIDYEKIGGLLKECHSNHSTCLNGKGICDVLNDSSFKIIEKSWNVGSYYKGFIFNSTYIENNRTVEGVLSLQRGNCTSFKGAEYLSPDYPGSIVSTLKICF